MQSVSYAEIVATVASKSVGMGTRDNIDEFTRTTSSAISQIGGADEGKAIIIINLSRAAASHAGYHPLLDKRRAG